MTKRIREKRGSAVMESMLRSYMETALWSSVDDKDNPLDKQYGPRDILVATRQKMREEVSEFLSAYGEHIGNRFQQAGHDLWLTRNRHGAGFWDGAWPQPAATILTEAAHNLGSVDLYVYRGKVRA